MTYTSHDLRKKWADFWTKKNHAIISSSSLIPENDPSVLFTTAGMHPLVPYLLGEKHPGGTRLANVQKCIRTQDIDEVGDNRHDTFFEMLGNWSLGEYFKKEAITWSYEFLTSPEYLGLDKNRLAFSVFKGDDDAPFDSEAFEAWKSLGISEKRIARLPKKNNWWGMLTGPCGPDTEMFYWIGDTDKTPESFNDDHEDWVEIWNDVFMEFYRSKEGTLTKLTQKNVDTGMGLERTLMIMNGYRDVFQIDTFYPLIQTIEKISGKNYNQNQEETKSMRIIADHIRTATMIMSDDRKFAPSNVEQGYIIRRLLRRAIRHGKLLGIEKNFCAQVATTVSEIFKDVYPETVRNKAFVMEELEREEEQFRKTLEKGEKEFEKMVTLLCHCEERSDVAIQKQTINGAQAFNLYETYGFPLEMTIELAKEKGLTVDEPGFFEAQKEHQEKSRAGSEAKFKGGLADHNEETTKLHTATHLLHAALRQILGTHVEQRGSNITTERLRFDFSHPEKMTPEQISAVEKWVNDAIASDAKVVCEEKTVDEAKAAGAMGLFEHKYGDKIKMYTMDKYSKEICGGPHAEHLGQLGHFKIQKEEAVARGVRRIKAMLSVN